MKLYVKIAEFSEVVSKIRRTQRGELLLQLNDTVEKADQFKCAINSMLGEDAEVCCLKQRVPVDIRDIDEVTTKEDTVVAIKSMFQLNSVCNEDIVNAKSVWWYPNSNGEINGRKC